MLHYPTPKTVVVALNPNKPAEENMGAKGALGPGVGHSRAGEGQDGLEKQWGLTHTHPQG